MIPKLGVVGGGAVVVTAVSQTDPVKPLGHTQKFGEPSASDAPLEQPPKMISHPFWSRSPIGQSTMVSQRSSVK